MDFLHSLFDDPTKPKPGTPLSAADLAKVKTLLAADGLTPAIQYYQLVTGCDLKTAMDVVRRMQLEEHAAHPYADQDWLPEKCPGCGADISTDTVEWVDGDTAKCPFCHHVIQYTEADDEAEDEKA